MTFSEEIASLKIIIERLENIQTDLQGIANILETKSESNVVVFTPNSQNQIVIGKGDAKPGQTILLHVPSGFLEKLTINDIAGTPEEPVTVKLEQPFTLKRQTYWNNLRYMQFDMNHDGYPGLTFQDRFFVRGACHDLYFSGFHTLNVDQVAWSIKPLEPEHQIYNITIESSIFENVPENEALYLGNNKYDPAQGLYLMKGVVVRGCHFSNCSEAIGLAASNFSLENNVILDTTAANPPATHAAIGIGKKSANGKISNNVILRSQGAGISLDLGRGPLVIEDNTIEEVGLRASDPNLGKAIYGLRFMDGFEEDISIRNNSFKNITTAAIQFGKGFFSNNRIILAQKLEEKNQFTDCAEKILY